MESLGRCSAIREPVVGGSTTPLCMAVGALTGAPGVLFAVFDAEIVAGQFGSEHGALPGVFGLALLADSQQQVLPLQQEQQWAACAGVL